MGLLGGKVALVTGGSRGLGLQLAEALAEMGANLALSARKGDELAEAKAHLQDSADTLAQALAAKLQRAGT